MKDRLANPEMAEYMERTELFSKHLNTLDWQTIRYAMSRMMYQWNGVTAVVLGVKPAYVFSDDELKRFNPEVFIPDRLKPNFFMQIKKDESTYQGWLVDYKNLVNTYRKYPDIFSDFDFGRGHDKKYVNYYIRRLKTAAVDVEPLGVIKTGLSLGYPYESVTNFVTEKIDRAPFDYKGFEFSATKNDAGKFRAFLARNFRESGMDKVLGVSRERIKSEFQKVLDTRENSVNVVDINGSKYLEIKFTDKKAGKLGAQFLSISKTALSGSGIQRLLNDFANRYDFPNLYYLEPEAGNYGRMGGNYESYFDAIDKSQSKNRIPYLVYEDSGTSVSSGLMVIDRSALVGFLKSNQLNKEASLFK